jgi:hypothetical protein
MDDPTLKLESLPGLTLLDGDQRTKRAVFSVDPASWVASEAPRATALRSSDNAHLAGWRLRREGADKR